MGTIPKGRKCQQGHNGEKLLADSSVDNTFLSTGESAYCKKFPILSIFLILNHCYSLKAHG